MVSVSGALKLFLSALEISYPAINNELIQGKASNFMADLRRESPEVVALLPAVLQQLSPNLHPSSGWPLVPPILPSPKKGTWVQSPNTAPIEPSSDPFYSPNPSAFVHLNNGDLIAIREVGLTPVFANVSKSYQISYRSESTLGEPTADVSLLLIPKNFDNRTVISYQTPEDAASILCAPSYAIASGDYDALVDMLLTQGWAVNIPDHEGPRSAFAAGINAGKTTLDSIRALYKLSPIVNFKFDRVGLHGFSGGSIATGHAIEMQPQYAPELKLTSAAIGGYVVDINATFSAINGGLFSGFSPTAIIGLSTEYPQLSQLLDDALKPEYKKRFFSPQKNCESGNLVNYIGQDIYTYMKDGKAFLQKSLVQNVFIENRLGKRAPQVPLFVYQGVQDEIAPVGLVDDVVDFYCKAGVPTEYSRQSQLAHLSSAKMSNSDVIDFFNRTLNGFVPQQCGSYESALTPTQHTASFKQITEMVLGYI